MLVSRQLAVFSRQLRVRNNKIFPNKNKIISELQIVNHYCQLKTAHCQLQILHRISLRRKNISFDIHPECEHEIDNKRRAEREEGNINEPGADP
jgi:hypothetical protein